MGRISNLRSRGEEVATDIQRNVAFASILGIPLFFGALTLAGPVMVTIYSDQFAGAAMFLVGLALFRLLRTQKSILIATLNGLDRPDLNFRVSAVVFPLNLLLGVGLLLTIGPIGVVVATVMSELVAYGVRAHMVRSLVPSVSILPQPLVEQVASGIIMAIVVFTARAALPLEEWIYVVAVVGLGGVTYFAALVSISSPFRATILAVTEDAGLR